MKFVGRSHHQAQVTETCTSRTMLYFSSVIYLFKQNRTQTYKQQWILSESPIRSNSSRKRWLWMDNNALKLFSSMDHFNFLYKVKSWSHHRLKQNITNSGCSSAWQAGFHILYLYHIYFNLQLETSAHTLQSGAALHLFHRHPPFQAKPITFWRFHTKHQKKHVRDMPNSGFKSLFRRIKLF